MRYYNQNPQTTYLLEKIEEQEKVIKEMQEKVTEAEEMCDECVKFAKRFNKMPWHKKMFYKFKL